MKLVDREDTYDVGVIVGRFQVPELHEAHRALVQHVCDQHDKVVMFLGLAPVATKENPLDFESRKQMILASFPQINVLYIKDVPSDIVWSCRLDDMVNDVTTPSQTAVIYGGRDSFIGHYNGHLPVRELEQDVWVSGSEIRKAVTTRSAKASADFRAGAIWAESNHYHKVHPTVDIAILDEHEQRVLLGRKPIETEFRFVGGFVDVKDSSLEAAARRETFEEVNIDTTDPVYVGSMPVDDWRYRSIDSEKILTTLFVCRYRSGTIQPGDDIVEARWFDLKTLSQSDVVKTHWPLLERLQNYIKTQDTDKG
jgi:bifunctional NMN adenylyltransferase/nudix hydrolase